jgi:hypothetical protein
MKAAVLVVLAALMIAAPALGKSGGHGAGKGHASRSAQHSSTSTSASAISSASTPGAGSSTTRHQNAPPAAPGRRVVEQDCSKPITLDGGNLKCK